jgi:hypothetical protein
MILLDSDVVFDLSLRKWRAARSCIRIAEGFPGPDLEEEPQVNASGALDVDPAMFKDIARKLVSRSDGLY